MVGLDELVVDDRTEERRGGRHTRSKSLCLCPTLLSLQASVPLSRASRMERVYLPLGSFIENAELAEHDGFHRGAWTGRGRCWWKEEVE
jgi:hypothetical protein